ncbi:23S rRNA (uracil(1939)-C(5))-methyltransferase RlmD [Shewanella sp. OPT22]|nr:23S rRNA (uracil(1939)-C(5))-methyltransferase RlmD [Shewanella sp. OPT22]
MAQFFKNKPRNSKKTSPKMTMEIRQLDHLGAGVAHHQGKVVFVPGALPSEKVELQLVEQKKKFAKGKLLNVIEESDERVEPECPHFAHCGGCDLQHLKIENQRKHKVESLKQIFSKLTNIEPEVVSIIEGEDMHYRRRAKLATYFDTNTKQLIVGFRQLASHKIEPIKTCMVIAPKLSALIEPLSLVLNQLKSVRTIGHVELIAGENATFVVIRTPKAIGESDKSLLKNFAASHNVILQLQHDNEIEQLFGEETQPIYEVNDTALAFNPGNFVQVNGDINQKMVAQAIDWLKPNSSDRVLDLFCGMGNFSLPLAKLCNKVVGIEGVDAAVEQAKQNAQTNHIENTEFYECDLTSDITEKTWYGKVDKLLLDPARAGAYEALQKVRKMNPERIVYVSCDPASLSRDSKLLIDDGYELQKLSMIDMFPQTHHIEAMALFTRES